MPGSCVTGSLVEFAFESEVAPGVPTAALLRLARQVSRFNTIAGITGTLCLEGGRIRQVIEGPCHVVLPLVARILTDRRHGAIAVTALRQSAGRRYVGWSVVGVDAAASELGFVGDAAWAGVASGAVRSAAGMLTPLP